MSFSRESSLCECGKFSIDVDVGGGEPIVGEEIDNELTFSHPLHESESVTQCSGKTCDVADAKKTKLRPRAYSTPTNGGEVKEFHKEVDIEDQIPTRRKVRCREY